TFSSIFVPLKWSNVISDIAFKHNNSELRMLLACSCPILPAPIIPTFTFFIVITLVFLYSFTISNTLSSIFILVLNWYGVQFSLYLSYKYKFYVLKTLTRL